MAVDDAWLSSLAKNLAMGQTIAPAMYSGESELHINLPKPDAPQEKCSTLVAMYEDFHVTDHWTQEDLHCRWTANVVAIATRHADAIDIRFEVNGRPVWIAMPAQAWVEQKQRSGHVITDRLAAQVAGHYLKQAAESGYDNGREMYTMSVAEVLEHVEVVMREAGHSSLLPELPVMPRS